MRKSSLAKKAVGILVVVVGILWTIGIVHEKQKHFRGVVQSVNATILRYPSVKIDNKKYILLYNSLMLDEGRYTNTIKPGDFLQKDKGSFQLIWIKKGSRDTVKINE